MLEHEEIVVTNPGLKPLERSKFGHFNFLYWEIGVAIA